MTTQLVYYIPPQSNKHESLLKFILKSILNSK